MEEKKENIVVAPGGYSLDLNYLESINRRNPDVERKIDVDKATSNFPTRFPELVREFNDPEIAFQRFLSECVVEKSGLVK